MKSNFTSRLKYGVSAITIAATIPFSIQASYAAEAAKEEATFEEVIVTGSRIARDEFSSASPISTFDATELTKAGVTSVDDFLKDVPAFTGFQLGSTTNNGNNGAKMVDLRGLGIKRTLVLINGRRQVGSFIGGNSDVGAVDMNSIPMALVKRIEVLKDGASTAYGSDALAGVVNVILQDDYEGFEVSADYGAATDKWDAENWSVSALGGASSDRGNFTASMQYTVQKELLQDAREFSEFGLYPALDADTNKFVAQQLGSSNSRRIRGLSADALATIIGAGGPNTGNYIVDAGTGIVRAYNGATDTYNYSAVNALVTPNERWQFATTGHYELLEDSSFGSLESYMETSFTKRTSHQRLAPDASFGVTPNFNGHWNDLVPASNPFNPFGDNANNPWGVSGEDVRINRRFVESGGRLFRQSASTFRMVAGLRGDVSDNLSWDASYTFADNEMSNETKNYGRFDRWEIAVDPALCAADAACVAAGGVLNPFGDYGSISPEQMAYISTGSLKDIYLNRMHQWQVNLTGDTTGMMELPGGPIGWAIGFETRTESAEFKPDEFIAGGLTTGGASSPVIGEQSVKEFYAEVLLPVLSNADFAKDLSIEASVRHSNYNTAADKTTNYRIGLNYAPVEDVRFRAVYSTGFRAPNIVEAQEGATVSNFPIFEDPCEFYNRRPDVNANLAANCLADGFGEDFEWGFQWQAQVDQITNANLKPEKSRSITLGAVITPTALPELSISIDYWNIKVNNFIQVINYNDIIRTCYNAADRSTTPACQVFSSGLNGRDDADQGGPDIANIPLNNLGKLETDGVDVNVNYHLPINHDVITGMTANVSTTWMNSRKESFPLIGTRDRIGTAAGQAIFPEWRMTSSLALEGENWYVAWDTRYIGKTDDDYRPAQLTDDSVAEAVWYHDITASYTHKDTTVTMGINNLSNVTPPRFHSAFNANTEPGTYDTIGRRFWAKVTKKF
ncbi:MAG: TonB-dependent receptor [Emcibacter sp.]|nr:TonB-dependent receptor [Emcibacter sp.]